MLNIFFSGMNIREVNPILKKMTTRGWREPSEWNGIKWVELR